MAIMKAAVFVEKNRIVLDDKPIPEVGPLDALIRITTTTICGTDVHILRGEYPVAKGLTVGHEPVGIIERLGSQVRGFVEGQRVIAGAITPSGQSYACLCGCAPRTARTPAMASAPSAAGSSATLSTVVRPSTCWCRMPIANLCPIPDGLRDEQVLMCPDIMSTGFSGARAGRGEDRRYRRGFRPRANRSLCGGRCTAQGRDHHHRRRCRARTDERRTTVGRDPCRSISRTGDVVAQIMALTDGRGVDVSIEALGTQGDASSPRCGCCVRAVDCPASGFTPPICASPSMPLPPGLGDYSIVTTLCPGGKERMRGLMAVVESGGVDLSPLVTHRFKLDDIEAAYDLFAHQRDGVMKVAITP